MLNELPNGFWLAAFFALGACIGSFLNVVVWRTPRDLSLVRPPSACPGCGHALAAWDNLPVIGWIFLRGRCRYCKMAISPEYPAVEAYTGLLFAGLYLLCYESAWRPSFAAGGLDATWPVFALHLLLAAALVAVTLVDTAFAIIPLVIPNFIAAAALCILPVAAACGKIRLSGELAGEPYVFAVSSSAGLWAVGGSVVMLGVANLGLRLGWLPHSFEGELPVGDDAHAQASFPEPRPWRLKEVLQAALIAWALSVLVGVAAGAFSGSRDVGILTAVVAALPIGLVALAVIKARSFADLPTNDEALPPLANPRKVALREALFMAFPVAGALGGLGLAQVCPIPAGAVPGWAQVLAGVVVGYLVGAGFTWAVRILGTLGFRKEAMGLGDVHLMGAIGAVLGPLTALAVFFMLAPFMGLLGALGLHTMGKFNSIKQSQLAIPYGPYLALGALLLMGIGLGPPDQAVGWLLGHFLSILGLDPGTSGGILATLHALAHQLAHG